MSKFHRAEDLSKHYAQAFEYWSGLVPNRPRYVILCNFDEFWIFDFDLQLDEPVDIVTLDDLVIRHSAFNFMAKIESKPIFRNNQVEVTEKAGRRLGELFQILQNRLTSQSSSEDKPPQSPLERVTFNTKTSVTPPPTSSPPFARGDGGILKIQRFILQCVLAMFAEDRGLLPDNLFIRCVEECLEGGNSYDVLGGLFREMNNQGVTPTGKYQGVDYFNGGLFSIVESIELTKPELEILATVARQNWSKIRPAIFGNIFEGTVNAQERHSYGMHYTSEADIMKIVRPTISKYWEDLIDSANTIKELTNLQLQLQDYKVLDPACGSGNFLYVAYQELKRIEQLLLDKIASKNKKQNLQTNLSFVTPNQFFGMDINPFAVELAKVTLMIARKVAIDKLNLTEPALPLDSLDNNIICADALFTDWQKANAIIGNPPFLGGARIRLELGDNYAEKIFNKFSNINKKVDFCTYWFRLSHENIKEKGRVGLVATNTISQGVARKASLDFVLENNAYIYEAFSSQEWTGEAAVYVSIINWCYEQPKEYYLDDKLVNKINSSLTTSIDVTQAKKIKSNLNLCFKGIQPTGKGFIVTEKQVQEWIKKDSKNQEVLKLFFDAKDLARNPHGKPSRWIIDFNNLSLESASDYKLPFSHIKINVKPERENNRDKKLKQNWWLFAGSRAMLREAINNLDICFAVPRVSKWSIFLPFKTEFLPADLNCIVASDDFYILGILTSKIHRIWVKAQCSTLKGDTRYTHTTCFETFPFPTPPALLPKGDLGGLSKEDLKTKIREKMIELHEYRTQQMETKQWGITKLYNEFFHESSSKLYQLHQQLDKLVMKAYNFDDDEDLLTQILALNLALSQDKF